MSGSTKQELSGRALDEFMLKKMGVTWDASRNPLVKPSDLDSNAISSFREKSYLNGRLSSSDLDISDSELLDNLRLIENGYPKNAAVLLFHEKPDRFIPGAYVKIAYFETGANIRYQDEIHGPLITLADKVMDILYTKYLKGIIYVEGTQRIDRYPVSKDSMREALLNSLIHKDYSQGAAIQIKVFPDKVFLFNAGKLPDGWTLETLFKTHGSKPNNPILASVAFRAGLIESWGRGIEKMVEGCKKMGADIPIINEFGGDMSVEFTAPEDTIPNNEEQREQEKADKKPIKADTMMKNT